MAVGGGIVLGSVVAGAALVKIEDRPCNQDDLCIRTSGIVFGVGILVGLGFVVGGLVQAASESSTTAH